LLRAFGAKVAKRCDVQGGAKIWLPENLVLDDGALIGAGATCYNQAMISLGRYALVSQGALLSRPLSRDSPACLCLSVPP